MRLHPLLSVTRALRPLEMISGSANAWQRVMLPVRVRSGVREVAAISTWRIATLQAQF